MIETTIAGFSKFFTFEELTATSHTGALSSNREEAKQYLSAGKRLSKLLESVRSVLGGKPLTVTSGFRGPKLNRKIGGAEKSKHLKFEAADVVPTHISVDTAFDLLQKHANELPDLRRVIIEKVGGKEWLHIEVKMDASEKQVFAAIGGDGNYKVVS